MSKRVQESTIYLPRNNLPLTTDKHSIKRATMYYNLENEGGKKVRELSTFGFDSLSLSLSGFSEDVTKPPGF